MKTLASTQFKNHALVFCLIYLSGSASFLQFKYVYVTFAFALVTLTIASRFKLNICLSGYVFLSAYSIVFFLQYASLPYFSTNGAINNLCRVFCGLFIVARLGSLFPLVIFNVVSIISAISLPFWLIYISTGMAFDFFPNILQKDIILWSTRPGELRNSGPLWEPGAFAGLIAITMAINSGSLGSFLKKSPAKCSIILLALISTQSTTGYVMLFMIIAFEIAIRRGTLEGIVSRLIVLILLFSLGIIAMMQLGFVGMKITNQFSSAQKNQHEFSNTRFGTIRTDLHYIQKSPIYGNGFHEITRFADHPRLMALSSQNKLGHPNGLFNMLASSGIPLVLLYFFLIYRRASSSLGHQRALSTIFCIFMILNTSQYFFLPLALGLPSARFIALAGRTGDETSI